MEITFVGKIYLGNRNMGQQRTQSYVELIQTLLSCPDGKETEILQAHQELLDPDLLQVMTQVAEQLKQQGNLMNAARLQNLATQLAKAMGLAPTDQSQINEVSHDSRQFFLEILQCIEQNQFAAKPVYQFLAANQPRLNADLLNTIPATALAIFAHSPKDQHRYHAVVIGTFGTLIQQFSQGQREINIELSIAAYQQSLAVMTQAAMPIDWATTIVNLGTAYRDRIRGDKAENMEAAIAAYQQSLTVRTQAVMPSEWAITMMNLANAYSNRIRGDKAENMEAAISAHQQALTVATQAAMPSEWATTMMNLATAYSNRIQGDKAESFEAAIAAYQQALTVRTQAAMPVEWAQAMTYLGTAYADRIRGDKAENMEAAIAAYQQALTVRTRVALPVEWAQTMMNLASVYSNRIHGDKAENIEAAIAAYQQPLIVFKPESLPHDCRRTARLLGNLLADNRRWAEALASYETALEAAEILYQASLSRSSQEAELAETGDLFRRAAYVQAQLGYLEKAVVTAEVGRARGLSETLDRDRADLAALETAAPNIYRQYQEAVEALRQLETEERAGGSLTTDNRPVLSQAEFRQQAETIRQELNAAIATIRQFPDYEGFLDQPNFDDIAAAVQPNQPLIYLMPTPNGSLALVVHQPPLGDKAPGPVEIYPIWLNTLTDVSLRELLVGSGKETAGWFGTYGNRNSNFAAWFRTIDQLTHQLWDLLMGPVATHLETLGVAQAVLIPTGYFSFLPLHAAWREDAAAPTGRRYAQDSITFAYAPNARSLRAAREIANRTASSSLLAVNEPRPTGASALPNSEREVEAALSYFPKNQPLKHRQANREAVVAALPHHHVLHFSCHGYANPTTPLDSGLLLANDEMLSLRDFFSLQLQGVRLAILSACETGLPGTKLPDEVISLPTGLLQAGVAGVVASLWSVADLSTTLLLVRFYDYWRTDNLTPAAALRQAQRWVRDTTNGEKLDYFEPSLPNRSSGTIPTATAEWLYGQLFDNFNPKERSFAHPFHWAAFSYVGA